MIAFDFATATLIVWPTEDQFDTLFLCFSFEDFRDKLFSIIEVNFTLDSSGAKRPAKSIDRRCSIFVKIDLTFHSIPRAVIGEPGDVDLSNPPNTKLKSIALPHTINVTTLESFACWLRFCFNTNEKSMSFENPVKGSLGTGQIKLVLDTMGARPLQDISL